MSNDTVYILNLIEAAKKLKKHYNSKTLDPTKYGKTWLEMACETQNMELAKDIIKDGKEEYSFSGKKNILYIAAINNMSQIAKIIATDKKYKSEDMIKYFRDGLNMALYCNKLTAYMELNNIAKDLDMTYDLDIFRLIDFNPRLTTQILKIKKIKLDIINLKGQTPLLIACHRNHSELAMEILKYECNPEQVDNEGNTALLWSCFWGEDMSNVILELLNKNCSVFQRNKFGMTALDYAKRNKLCDILNLLTELSYKKEPSRKGIFDIFKDKLSRKKNSDESIPLIQDYVEL